LRYIIGFHDERVAELEAELDRLRGERIGIAATIESLRRALKQVGIETEIEIQSRQKILSERLAELRAEISMLRGQPELQKLTEHAADQLRDTALALGRGIAELDDAMAKLSAGADRDRRHLNELETLSVRFKRSRSAREVLSGVLFNSCPRCAQTLPERHAPLCHVCAQTDVPEVADPQEAALIERDLKQRMAELTDILQRHDVALGTNRKQREELVVRKSRIERERNEAFGRPLIRRASYLLEKESTLASRGSPEPAPSLATLSL
jgi:hypothetical protein